MDRQELRALQALLTERHHPGVTLRSVATSTGVPVRSGRVLAEGDLDFRGTLSVDGETPVGFSEIRPRFELDTDAGEEELATLLGLTERFCTVFQTLARPPRLSAAVEPT
jgi:uncharacterized OsmC-like protein